MRNSAFDPTQVSTGNVGKLIEKWSPVLNAEGTPKIVDNYRLGAVAQMLENQERGIQEERAQGNSLLTEAPTNVTGANIDNWDPVLISMVRRSAPNLIAFDITGVQPMSGPVGLIFCMKSRYIAGSPATLSKTSDEALGTTEADTDFSGTGTHAGDSSSLPSAENVYESGSPEGWSNSDDADLNGLNDAFGIGSGYATSVAEQLDSDASPGAENYFKEMGFTIEKTSVTATSRALRANYSVELAQDLRAIHGLDAEAELANMLSTEIMAEQNREIIRTVNQKAKLGCQHAGLSSKANGGPGGVFDLSVDADGRWSVEKYRGLLMQLEREANDISKDTRRGRGNFVLCSSDVASALNAAGVLQYDGGNTNGLTFDDSGNTFAGTLFNRMRVFIDPYATVDYLTVGYRGASPMDAGLFYCPYVSLTPYRATEQNTFQPTIGFKTRYGLAAHPFAEDTPQNGTGTNRANKYFRIMAVKNILA